MKIFYILLLVTLVEIQSKKLDPPVPQRKASTHKRFATKEVILYLTQDQIRALESGESIINSSSLVENAIRKQNLQNQLTLKENYDHLRKRLENIKDDRDVIPVYEQQEEEFQKVSEIPRYKQEERQADDIGNLFQNYEYKNPLRQQQTTLQKLQLQPDQFNQNEPEIHRNLWFAYDSASEKRHEESLHEQFKQKWNKILELNRKQLKSLSEQGTHTEESIQVEKPLLQLQYATKYNDQKNAIAIEKLVRERHQEELDRQSALVQAETIANDSPKLIHQKVTIKHRPVPELRRVNVPPTHILFPIPVPYKVNIPRPYPVPQEFFKFVPEETENTEDKTKPNELFYDSLRNDQGN